MERIDRSVLSLWFDFSRPVGRRAYAATGFSLMALKYASDAALIWIATGSLWRPLDYLSPLLSIRAEHVGRAHEWLVWVLLAWTLPFVWVGASMTMRRAVDAGIAPWSGLLFFVPVVNYLWMLLLCVLPHRDSIAAPATPAAGDRTDAARALLRAAAPAAALGVGVVCISVLVFGSYFSTLFVGTPFAVGFIASWRLNRDADRGLRASLAAALLALLLAAGALLVFALEGVVCLVMALPLGAALAVLGALLARMVSRAHPPRAAHASVLLVALPLLTALDVERAPTAEREVLTAVEVDAAPDVVWRHVVDFPDLPPPRELVFSLGVAYPVRAQIDGAGVGATRRCEFSTGAFVEPITAWDPPRLLAFDVVSQPAPLRETSPYSTVYAPHLAGSMLARRGEFRLAALPSGRTRLEGRTWYRLEMGPQSYWGFFADRFIHAIHARVLAHVAALAEREGRAAGAPSSWSTGPLVAGRGT